MTSPSRRVVLIRSRIGKSTKIIFSNKSTVTLLKIYSNASSTTCVKKSTQIKVKSKSLKLYYE